VSKRIVILASGGGSNAEKLMQHFNDSSYAEVVLVACNRKKAGVYAKAQACGIESMHLSRSDFYESDRFEQELRLRQIDLVVLAGFLWFIPESFIRAFDGKIVNIHPSLLPKFGGKGMFGQHVHEAVKAAGESQSGMTIHWVNEKYDEGGIIFQDKVDLDKSDSAEEIGKKVLQLEHKHFARVVDELLRSQ
jgi:phosphoribosylglycinamide formyltransferase-1